jgi:hypothetical protein
MERARKKIMKKFALALLATAVLSMLSCSRQQEQQSPEAQPQTGNQTTQNQPTEGQPQTGNQATQNQPTEGQPQTGNQATQNQPTEGQPQTGNQATQNQPISPDSLSRDEVRQVQKALDKAGFHAGAADGRWGPETSNALKQFQQSKNIQANGTLDQQTLSGLGLNGAQFAQLNKHKGKSGRSGSRPFLSLHPTTLKVRKRFQSPIAVSKWQMLKVRKRFQSPVAVSEWQIKSSPNLPRQTFFDGGRRHGTASTPWRAHVPAPKAVFVGGTYVGSDPDPNIRAALRREFGRM